MDLFACCIRPDRHSPDSYPTETTRLFPSDGTPSTPIIDHQPLPVPPPEAELGQDEEDELQGIFEGMVETMVRPRAPNPFLTGPTGPQTPSTSRNPSPRSLGTSSRGASAQRSLSRGRSTNAFQVRRVRINRGAPVNGAAGGSVTGAGQEAVREEEEGNGMLTEDNASVRTGTSDAPTRMSTQTRDELERLQYTVRLKPAEVVRPWKSQISQG
ncbi:hypothetical protein DACRYDRAFT_93590 [Dacryopinax primogenitus]|uniref:Uncharacterized protein n=1 Tax=Dacryopinax primogenitus (strain DJM 731) TaxID=1858805 RepID=M5G679_DACPD|nr:uncharacterized protein DACRYDRAFT_93590 [Dacryopinax primogenitus]EJU04189.1 hypothetical protein DACRYDRAFT_93590 [Dacryopinax primogenitus]